MYGFKQNLGIYFFQHLHYTATLENFHFIFSIYIKLLAVMQNNYLYYIKFSIKCIIKSYKTKQSVLTQHHINFTLLHHKHKLYNISHSFLFPYDPFSPACWSATLWKNYATKFILHICFFGGIEKVQICKYIMSLWFFVNNASPWLHVVHIHVNPVLNHAFGISSIWKSLNT